MQRIQFHFYVTKQTDSQFVLLSVFSGVRWSSVTYVNKNILTDYTGKRKEKTEFLLLMQTF